MQTPPWQVLDILEVRAMNVSVVPECHRLRNEVMITGKPATAKPVQQQQRVVQVQKCVLVALLVGDGNSHECGALLTDIK